MQFVGQPSKSLSLPSSHSSSASKMPLPHVPSSASLSPAESPAGPVDVVSAPVELPFVDVDTLVIAGPVEKPGGAASPQAARNRTARIGARMASQA